MLIDFTVENFRSLKDAATLSAVAQTGRVTEQGQYTEGRDYIKSDQEIAPAFPIAGRDFELLPVLGIFGANASGKSNVLAALDILLGLMANERTPLELIKPFGLSEATAAAPTQFKLRLALNSSVYTYSLSVNPHRVLDERLEQTRPGSKRNSLLFSRTWNEPAHQYVWKNGEELGVYRQLQDSIKPSETFLGLLTTRFNVDVLQPLTQWVNTRWQGVGQVGFDYSFSVWQFMNAEPKWKNRVVQIIRKFDTGLADIELEEKQVGKSLPKLIAVHQSGGDSVRWSFEEESLGTQRLFSLINKVVLCLDAGTLILEDELGSNIHPHVSEEIVRLFQSPVTNPRRTQLVFFSHDTTLQQRNLLRRDQIWFTEKRPDGGTELYPLTDFKPPRKLAIDKAYLDGRFGAVPILPDTEDLFPLLEAQKEQELAA